MTSPTSCLALALLFTSALSACGGGGGDPAGTPPAPASPPASGPAPAPAPAPAPVANTRAATGSFDYDANGVIDAREELSYNAQGRLTLRRYVYIGDGTRDLEALYGTESQTEENRYDAQNRLETNIITYADGRTNRFVLQYAADGTLARMDNSSLATDGSPVSQGHQLYTYVGGRLAESTRYQDGVAVMHQTLRYDTNGRPAISDMTNPVNPAVFNTRSEFEWNADGTLAVSRLDINRDGVQEQVTTYTYNAGRLARSVRVTGGRYAGQPGVTYTFSRDGAGVEHVDTDIGSNGSVEARHSVTFEAGVCRPIRLPMMIPLITATGHNASATGDVSFCA